MKAHICYSHNDLSVVLPICEKLRSAGLQFDINQDSLETGEDFAFALTKSIDSADIVIFFYSQYAEESVWVRREIEYAVSKKKKIVPILLSEPIYDSWCRQLLDQNQFFPIFEGDTQLISFIRSHVSKTQKGAIEAPCATPPVIRMQKKKTGFFLIAIILFILALITIIHLCFFYYQNYSTRQSSNKELMGKTQSQSESQRNIEQVKQLERALNETESEIKCRKHRIQTIRENDYEIQVLEERKKELQYLLNNYKEREEYNLDSTLDTLFENNQEHDVSRDDSMEESEKNTYPWIIGVLTVLLVGSVSILIVLLVKGKSKQRNKEKVIKCFIEGSKALQTERDALRSVISIMYNKWSTKNFRILSYTFEDFDKSVVMGGHQAIYNQFIRKDADWAIFVIDGQVGGITQEEFRIAMTAFKEKGKPKILALAKSGSNDNDEILAIKTEINKEHQYWTDYLDINSLKQIFETTLNWDLINMYM